MNKTLMAAGLAVVLGACNSSKKSDGVERNFRSFCINHSRNDMKIE